MCLINNILQYKIITMEVFVKTQLCIQSLRIPLEIADLVKEFLFYDRITGNTRIQKIALISEIQNAPYSRKAENTSENEGHWCFCADTVGATQFQAVNCVRCGNYDFPLMPRSRNMPDFCEKVYCKCPDGWMMSGVMELD